MAGTTRPWQGYTVFGILVFVPIYLMYLETHPYPSLGGGLYLMMGEEIVANSYTLPVKIPHYTAGGIPFGYPPLMLFVIGFLLDIGVPPLGLSRILPGVLVMSALVAYATAAKAVLKSHWQGAFAAIAVASSPPVLELTLTAGGTVRATALLFTSAGIYAGVRLFRTGSRTWLFASTGLFGAILLTHPLYTVFFGVSHLALYVGTDRTLHGLVHGIVVAVGGVVLASPWWLSIGSTHRFDLFVRASNTHGGIGYANWFQQFLDVPTLLPSLWPILAVLGGVYLLARRRPLLPIWFVATGFLTGRDEYLMIVGGMMIAPLLFEGVVPFLRNAESVVWRTLEGRWNTEIVPHIPIAGRLQPSGPRIGVLVVLVLGTVATYGTASAALYAAGGGTDDQLSMFVHDGDVEAMEWVAANTTETASFVVIGDVTEWFPLLTHRTSLVVPQGSEWEGARGRQLHLRDRLQQCLNVSCLTSILDQTELAPSHIYLSRAGYNTQQADRRWARLGSSFRRSPEYEVVFENHDALIVRLT